MEKTLALLRTFCERFTGYKASSDFWAHYPLFSPWLNREISPFLKSWAIPIPNS